MEHTYIITGTVEISTEDEDLFFSPDELVEECDQDLADHLEFDIGKVVTSIRPGFVLDDEDELISRAIVKTSRVLTRSQKDELLDFVSGQYSDGWGECYEQRDNRVRGVYVSPWHEGQELKILQVD